MKKTTILIIDDESSIRRLISKVLLKEGYDILTADGGEKAVEIALANKIDLALVDLKMPGIDGIETIRRIKKTNSGAAFIIITAFAEMSSLKDALELGVFDYITKPFDLEYLKHLVRHIVIGVRPGVLPYFEDTRQTLDGRLELGQLKKKKMDAFKEDIKERMAVLKEEDNYIDRTIAGSCDSLAGLIKYKTKKFITNSYTIVTVLGVILGCVYGYVYGALSTRSLHDNGVVNKQARHVGIADFYDVLKDLSEWVRVHEEMPARGERGEKISNR